MAGKGAGGLTEAMKALSLSSRTCRNALPIRLTTSSSRRSMATAATSSNLITSVDQASTAAGYNPLLTVPVTIYNFPTMEPRSLESWSTKHLYLPLRRDILHLAVVYEGDMTRQGTASSKNRWEVHGSHKKLRPQKGSGRARVGDKQSPLRRGGGKSFGPKPRDFSTSLNRKVYDLAWRTALSYRYRRGELTVCQDGMELPLPDDFLALAQAGRLGRELEDGYVSKYVKQMLHSLEWGKANGRTLFVTGDRRPNLFTSLEVAGEEARALEVDDVDVKDLLETGRVVVERSALKEMIERHQSDLVSRVFINGVRRPGPAIGETLVE